MRLVTAGAFARLCGISKAALLFYDREGLLKPVKVTGNGYRHYAMEQFYTFDLISMLKKTGCSLKEIKKHLDCMDGQEFLKFLEDRHEATCHELRILLRNKHMITDMIGCLRESLAAENDVPRFGDMPEERLELWTTDERQPVPYEEDVLRFRQYKNFIESDKYMPRTPFGMMLDLPAALRGSARESYYFHRARPDTAGDALYIKKAGYYAIMTHRGPMDSHAGAMAMLFDYISQNGAAIKGDRIFAYDLLSYIRQDAGYSLTCKFCVEVKI